MRIGTLVFLILFPALLSADQQASTVVAPDVSTALVLVRSARWTERSKGLEAATILLNSGTAWGDTDKLRLSLIRLLVDETSAAKDPATTVTDDEREVYSNYYGNLIGTVADLNDPRAISALLAVADTGRMATRGVAHFGKLALDPVLQQSRNLDPQLAEGAVFVILDMLEYRTVSDPDSLARLKNALRSALARPDVIVRESAIYAIEYLNDRQEFVPMLSDIAERDPFKVDGQVAVDEQDNGDVYPVRRIARLLLAKIANHEKAVVPNGVPAP